MPNISADRHFEDIERLSREYQHLSWLSRLFYPKILKEALDRFAQTRTNEHALQVHAAVNNTSRLQKGFFSALRIFFNDNILFKTYRVLNTTTLLTQNNFDQMLNNEKSQDTFSAFVRLKNEGLLTTNDSQVHFDAIVKHPDPLKLAEAFIVLHEVGLLTPSNRKIVEKYLASNRFDRTLFFMKRAGLLTGADAQNNFNDVFNHKDSYNIGLILDVLRQSGLLTQAQRQIILAYPQLAQLSDALDILFYRPQTSLLLGASAQANLDKVLQKIALFPASIDFGYHNNLLQIPKSAGLFKGPYTQANFDAIMGHPNPDALQYAFQLLDEEYSSWFSVYNTAKLLQGSSGQANFNAIVSRLDNPSGLARALKNVDKHSLLKGSSATGNRDAVATHPAPGIVADVLEAIAKVRQSDFDQLMHHSAVVMIPDIWNRIPRHLRLTPAQFKTIIRIAEAHATNPDVGQEAVRTYIDGTILGNRPVGAQHQNYNQAQSTHTASVHRSVSESATRLKTNYGKDIANPAQLQQTLESLSQWLNKQSTSWFKVSDKVKVAKRGLKRLSDPSYHHVDPVSGVSTQELIALLWHAIKDSSKLTCTLKEAQKKMIDALYESQREYNLSDTHVDLGGADRPACCGGTFNKFIEKFTGIHSDAQLIVVTPEGASAKFQALVKEKAFAYLHQLKNGGKTAELAQLLDAIMAEDNQDTVEPLWNQIAADVENEIFDEFKSLYNQDKNDTRFRTLISAGEYVTLSKDELQKLRPAAVGATVTTTAKVSEVGIFAQPVTPGNARASTPGVSVDPNAVAATADSFLNIAF